MRTKLSKIVDIYTAGMTEGVTNTLEAALAKIIGPLISQVENLSKNVSSLTMNFQEFKEQVDVKLNQISKCVSQPVIERVSLNTSELKNSKGEGFFNSPPKKTSGKKNK